MLLSAPVSPRIQIPSISVMASRPAWFTRMFPGLMCLVNGLHSAEAVVHHFTNRLIVEDSPLALPVNDRYQVGIGFPVCIEGRKSVWYWYC